ncbi:MAG: tetratricopeptide repeat protein [Polyangiaceae bacterium]|nr:tetratricopeptide repeat protein [Polyangiaceae bacterium]MCB9608093.1 tetratricopeptide repeat protein [Polyangiaceae bacterium]
MALDREKTLQTAQKYVDKKKYDRAIEEYQKIVQADPNDARTLLKIGDLQARMQAYAEAIATYDRVGQYYSQQGFALKAIAVYKQIRELVQKHVPQLADRYGHIVPKLAEIYTQLGLTSDALAAYDEVATRLQRGGRDRDAIEVFRKMVSLDQTNPLPHLRLAEACCRVQSLDEAIESFWTASQLLLELRRRDDALKVVERILHFRPETKYALVAAELYIERGGQQDGLQALAKLQAAFQKEPRNLDILSLLARAFTLIGQGPKAIEVYKEMARIARDQNNAQLFRELLDHLLSVAPNDEGVAALQRLGQPAAETQPGPVSVESVSDAEVESVPEYSAPPQQQYQDHRQPQYSAPDVVVVDEALEAAEELIDPDSVDARGHVRKALVDAESFRKLRLYSKALETLRIALEIDPRGISIREKLRDILWESGDRDSSIGEMITIAAIHQDEGRPELAEAQLYAVLEAEPEHVVANQMLADLGAYGGYAQEYAGYSEHEQPTGHYAEQGYEQQYAEQQYAEQQYAEQGYEQQQYSAEAGNQEYYEQAEYYEQTEYQYEQPQQAYQAPQGYEGQQAYDPNEPLPSYDLEEIGASEALANDRPLQPPVGFEAVDDPFDDAPLPSFPLTAEEEDDDLMAGLGPASSDYASGGDFAPVDYTNRDAQPQFDAGATVVDLDAQFLAQVDQGAASSVDFDDIEELDDDDLETASPPDVEPMSAAADSGQSELIEEVLDEAEFFAARGLWEDAKAIVEDQLRRVPGHPLLLERLREIELAIEAQTDTESGARERAPLSESPEDNAFDIAASLGALDELEEAAPPESRAFSHHDDVDVDQVFAKFKEGVRAQVSDQDSATHYDLGVAYKEMGLLADAIGEFELASRDSIRECMCYAMIGMIHLEQGDLDRAAEAYVRGLAAQNKTVEQEMSLYYDLGNVYEMKGSAAEAVYYFEKIARRDPGYRDVKERIEALRPQQPTRATAARAVNDDEEFDRVFDDLFESK